ncbi:ABC transporter ATP-binding protein [Bacillus carboniphilus]|uniref:ABC transporter ATP-binding protein n=1 Tax=Bacillus carboniphilus TaxID=86663 RepID=A0ABY9JTG8_9BACI|nr:ABC transporter ATP-binding protein [Bacillus carboniphilus]WLR42686.1 ABC transporter ATP-binding protein [Bacillus carboniphilus]
MREREALLDVQNLAVSFSVNKQVNRVVDQISFQLHEGEILGIVGESGSGKSVTSLSIIGLLASPPGRIEGGEIEFDKRNLLTLSEKQMRKIRGNDISMIFQEPMTSLNPLFTIGDQLSEALKIHKRVTKKQATERSIEVLTLVGLPRAEELLSEYPHQLSGGMRQRVMIAMAMICEPRILIADEPTTALDVTIQSQILALMKKLNKETGTSIMLITHDLGVVAEVCDRVLVMYAGEIVEQGDVKTILKEPEHPYTLGLLKSVPSLKSKTDRLYSIPGTVPNPGAIQTGCSFAPRCEFAFDRCHEESPGLYQKETNDHEVRCFLQEKEREQYV